MSFISNLSQRTKRALAWGVCAVMVGAVILTVALVTYVPRSQTLRILNWEDYMPRSVIQDFEKKVRNATGKKFRVKYETAESNEHMYRMIATKKSDYDLICVSEYMFERMFIEKLLLPINFTSAHTNVNDYATEVMDPINEIFKERAVQAGYESADDVEGMTFAVPYVYGTNGIMVNPKKIYGSSSSGTTAGTTNGITLTEEQLKAVRGDMKSWGVLWNEKNTNVANGGAPTGTGEGQVNRNYTGLVSMKNVARDAYSAALLYHFKDELLGVDGDLLLERIMQEAPDTTNSFLALAEAALKEQKNTLGMISKQSGYEEESGKYRMSDTRLNRLPAIGLYWSCDAGFVMSDNKDIEFYVPDQGSNWWVDAWVMPKFAVNKSTAIDFLDFISEKDNAIKNMKYTGSTSAVTEARTTYYNELKNQEVGNHADAKFFKNTSKFSKTDDEWNTWREMYLATIFPAGSADTTIANDVLDRCKLFRYLGGTNDTTIGKMWSGVKSSK